MAGLARCYLHSQELFNHLAEAVRKIQVDGRPARFNEINFARGGTSAGLLAGMQFAECPNKRRGSEGTSRGAARRCVAWRTLAIASRETPESFDTRATRQKGPGVLLHRGP